MVNDLCVRYGSSGSAIRELFEYGKKRKAIVGENNVYDFSLGNPNTPAPKEVNQTIIKLLTECDPTYTHGYTSSNGDHYTKEVIVENLNKKYNAGLLGKYIYLTCGAAAGLTIALKSIATSNDDEVVVIAPYFPEYSLFIENANMKQVVSMSNKDMLIDFIDLEKKFNKNTKAIIIDSPNNPTGVVYDENIIKELACFLTRKQIEYGHDIYLISDEPYRELIYSNKEYPFVTRYYDNSIVIYSYSKALSLPGERIGYIALNPRMKDVENVYFAIKGAGRLLGYVCAPSLFQYVIKEVDHLTSDLSTYKENRALLYEMLTKLGYEVIYPDGAFYMFVKALENDSEAFSKKAMKYDLLLVPSDSFGVKGYVRLAYCVKKETIINSYKAFEALKKDYEGK